MHQHEMHRLLFLIGRPFHAFLAIAERRSVESDHENYVILNRWLWLHRKLLMMMLPTMVLLSLKTGKLNWAEEVSLFDWKRKTMMGLLFCGGFSSFTPSRSRLLLLLLFFIARELRPWEIPIGLHFSSRKIRERRSGARDATDVDRGGRTQFIRDYFVVQVADTHSHSFFLSFV